MSCCRRQSEHQSHIQPTCPDFLDVLREVPTLLALVSSSDWAALLGCSRQLRHAVHSSVRAVQVANHEDVILVLKGSWPQLGLIKREPAMSVRDLCHFNTFRPSSSCYFHLIATLYASLHNQFFVADIVRPLAKQLQLDQHIAATFQNLQSAGWQQLTSLSIFIEDLSKEVTDDVL